ncbi:NADPH:quinone oxidoreductase-like [Cornus florida]|uniref:NADPH:quinone oxidoreductase-like n=1 Tax=Cornus florida TaxID=4283 RepID=UPI00289D1F24|nr:NADPH:quinone oxidoreductase-like [Cornus florida]
MEAVAAKPIIKVVALYGSFRKASFNRGLLHYMLLIVAIKLSRESINGLQIEYIDIAPLPMLNTDLEKDGRFLPAVVDFRQNILEADNILFASSEYNYSPERLQRARTCPAFRSISSGNAPRNRLANEGGRQRVLCSFIGDERALPW